MNFVNNPEWVEVDVEGERTGMKYNGRFYVKPFLKVSEKTEAVKLASKLTFGVSDPDYSMFLRTLAFLKIHVIESDGVDWWKNDGQDLLDEKPATELAFLIGNIQNRLSGKEEIGASDDKKE